MGYSTSVTKSYVYLTNGSAYMPLTSGKLLGVKVIPSPTAASSEIRSWTVKISSVSFGGVQLIVSGNGPGIFTAPGAVNAPIVSQRCDLQVKTGVSINLQIKSNNQISVTPYFTVIGVFAA